jgi:hypothetical protein
VAPACIAYASLPLETSAHWPAAVAATACSLASWLVAMRGVRHPMWNEIVSICKVVGTRLQRKST